MKWLDLNWLRRPRRSGTPLRGRIHKISVIRGGEYSIVIRLGLEEAYALKVQQGALIEIVQVDDPGKATK